MEAMERTRKNSKPSSGQATPTGEPVFTRLGAVIGVIVAFAMIAMAGVGYWLAVKGGPFLLSEFW